MRPKLFHATIIGFMVLYTLFGCGMEEEVEERVKAQVWYVKCCTCLTGEGVYENVETCWGDAMTGEWHVPWRRMSELEVSCSVCWEEP